MDVEGLNIVVTGGAGFIGSHLCERLVQNNTVTVVDDCSNGNADWLPDAVRFIEGDLRQPAVLEAGLTTQTDLVFHFAADRSVQRGELSQFRENNRLTEAVLDRMQAVDVRNIAFTSSSTVYGEAPRPTPEDHGPLAPVSMYGASKLAEEGLLSVFAHNHDFTVWVFRFANIVGPRLQAGAVIPDFIEKLRKDPSTLTILGNGQQEKSYLHVDDCIEGMIYIVEHAPGTFDVFNLGTRTTTGVIDIADIVAAEMGVDPDYEFTGGERGWTGDVPRMQLAIDKLESLGWEPSLTSEEAVKRATAELVAQRMEH